MGFVAPSHKEVFFYVPPYPTWKPILGGGYFLHLLQISVYETHTHYTNQAIHVPGWGWG